MFAFAIKQHIIATVGFSCEGQWWYFFSLFPLLPYFLKLCQHIDSFRVGDGQDKRGGWGMKRKQSGATLTARWGNQKTRGNQKYYTWQSKDSPPATAGNQKHPWAIKEPFSAIALHTQTVRGKKTKKDMLWRFLSHLFSSKISRPFTRATSCTKLDLTAAGW